jgi:dolichyl-phosphate beta-glucosyltransferase
MVRIVSYAPNRGKGYAVRRGLQTARGQWRIFTDVDLAYGFDDIVRLAGILRAGAEVAIASRSHPESRLLLPSGLEGYAYRRRLQSVAFSALVRLVLPIKQRDTQAGLKGMTGRMAQLIAPRIHSDGFEFDCEFLVACLRLGIHVTEVPVCVRYEDRASTTNMRAMIGMLGQLWRIRRDWPPVSNQPGQARAIPSGTANNRQAA